LASIAGTAESTLNSNSDVINNVAALNDFINADLTARATTTQRSQFRTLFLSNVRNPAKIVSSGLNGINALPNFSVPTDPFNPCGGMKVQGPGAGLPVWVLAPGGPGAWKRALAAAPMGAGSLPGRP
jgi:hypothetical protein